jgi:pimeloyl-ACP methyl ester carboxylesterase
MIDWVDEDLTELLDHLNVDRFGVMGWSAGGQYALAVTFRMPTRVTGCAVISGCPPMDEWVIPRDLNRGDRVLSALSARRSWAARACFSTMHFVAAKTPHVIVDIMRKECEPDEAAAIRSLGLWGPTALAEGTRNPQGLVEEYLAMDSAWGFSPEEVSGAVHVFHGTADKVIPPSWGVVIARRVPGAELTSYEGEGHMIGVTRRREVLEWLRVRAPAAGG